MITGKGNHYKFYWDGIKDRTVGVLLTEKWVEKVFEVQHFSDWIFILKMVICKSVHSFISVYTPKVDRSDADRDCFYD